MASLLRDRRYWVIVAALLLGWGASWAIAYYIIQHKLAGEVISEAERILDE